MADTAKFESELKEKAKRTIELTPKVEFVPLSAVFNPGATLKSTRVIDQLSQV